MTEKKLKKKRKKISIIMWLILIAGLLFAYIIWPQESPIMRQSGDGIYNAKGVNKLMFNDYKGAIEDFTQSIKYNSKYTDAYYNRGMAKYHLGDYTGALKDFNKAKELEPKRSKDIDELIKEIEMK